MDKVIEINNLTKNYPAPKGKLPLEALKDVSFFVEKGEVFGILGPNGAGKTTTLEIIECIKPQTSGEVTVLGFDNLESADEIKKVIGVQLQQSQYLHHLSLGELLDLFRSFYPSVSLRVQPKQSINKDKVASSPLDSSRKQDSLGTPRNDTKALLELVNLTEKEHAEFADLSGGQKQRFTIATSLVHEPRILFLDEPTTGLDPKARRDMWELVKTINARGITIVLTTHYMEEAEFLCHRVAIMDQGKILEIDEPKKLIDRLSDTIQISFFTDKPVDPNIFKTIPEIKKVHAEYPKMTLEITTLDKISAVAALLKQNQIIFYGFTVKTATLEDVYLSLTGKEYQDE
ncbi:MAG: ABC transporter ATP-binding protein [Candidatus Doudnabacteria bacterium]|nr:ABC transporter ATP-binding protein [Candidatus Doudnabacteria bacterium]